MSIQKFPGLYEMQSPSLFRTSLSHNEVTPEVLAQEARKANLSAGDRIIVQCMSWQGDKLFAEAEFRVIGRDDSLESRDLDGYRSVQETITKREIVKIREWKVWNDERAVRVRWNPGTKTHQVVKGEVVLFESADKQEAERFAA